MRLLRVIHSMSLETGGPRTGILAVNRHLRQLGHSVEVVTADSPEACRTAPNGELWHCHGPAGGYGYSRKLNDWLNEHIAEYDAVVLHGHWQYPTWAAARAAQRRGITYVVYSHGMLDKWFNRTYRLKSLKKQIYWWWREHFIVSHAEAVLHTSQQERERSIGAFWPFTGEVKVAPYGIDPIPQLPKRTPGGQERYILFLGRITEKKGIDLLISAFRKVIPCESPLSLLIVGPCADRRYMDQMKALAGADERIRFMGAIDGAEKHQLINDAEVFCLPSHQENFGIAVVEALSVGVPVLITKEVGIWKEVVNAKAGYAESDDKTGIEKLLQCWVDVRESQRNELRINAIECYKQNFTSIKAASALLNVVNGDVL